MSWKDLKRFWPKSAEANSLIGEAYTESNQKFGSHSSQTEATATAYGVIDSASTRDDNDDVVHLVVGSYNLWPSYFIATVLGKFGYTKQKVVVVVPRFMSSGLKKEILNQPGLDTVIILLRSGSDTDMDKLKEYKLASVYIHSYEYMFNWEHYGLDLSPGGYVIFSGVRLPIAKFYTLEGWNIKGKYGSLFFVSRAFRRGLGLIPTEEELKRIEDRSNDTNQGPQPEGTEEEFQDTGA